MSTERYNAIRALQVLDDARDSFDAGDVLEKSMDLVIEQSEVPAFLKPQIGPVK